MTIQENIIRTAMQIEHGKSKGWDTSKLEHRLKHLQDDCANNHHDFTRAIGLGADASEYMLCNYCQHEEQFTVAVSVLDTTAYTLVFDLSDKTQRNDWCTLEERLKAERRHYIVKYLAFSHQVEMQNGKRVKK